MFKAREKYLGYRFSDYLCLRPCEQYFGGQLYWWRKAEYPEKTTDQSQVTDRQNLSHNVASSTPRYERGRN